MTIYKHPAITIFHALLWAAGLIAGHFAYLAEKKIPSDAPAWKKVCGSDRQSGGHRFSGAVMGIRLLPHNGEESHCLAGECIHGAVAIHLRNANHKDDWKRIAGQPKVVALTVVLRWLVPPFVAFLTAQALVRCLPHPIGGMLGIGMLLIATTPTGVASNAMTLVSRGDLALSVSITTVNNVVAPFLQPALVALLAGTFLGKLNTWPLFVELLEIVLAPVILGSIVGAALADQVKRIKPALGAAAVLCVSMMMLANIARSMGTLLRQLWIIPWMVVATAILTLAGLLAGYYLPKYFGFNVKQRVATCFGVAVENGNLATVLALNHFGPLAALPSIFYGKLQNVIGMGLFVRKFQNMPELAEEQQGAEAAKGAEAGG